MINGNAERKTKKKFDDIRCVVSDDQVLRVSIKQGGKTRDEVGRVESNILRGYYYLFMCTSAYFAVAVFGDRRKSTRVHFTLDPSPEPAGPEPGEGTRRVRPPPRPGPDRTYGRGVWQTIRAS